MNIFITGGTGLIGSTLIDTLLRQGHKVTVLTRNVGKAKKKLPAGIDYCTSLEELQSLDGYDAVINFAGAPIMGSRWTKKRKELLCNSRWDITRRLTELIKASEHPPQVFISGSAIGYYGAQDDNVISETAEPHDEFTYQLCKKWEALAIAAESSQTRVCISRTGIVLSGKGGMLPMMALPFKIGLGSVLGKGSQFISWIHIKDMVDGIIYLLNMPEAKGAFNMTAPYPVTNRRFAKILASTLFRPRIFTIPSFLIKIALGEASTMLLDGQRAIPQRLTELHYRFSYEHLDEAIGEIVKNEK